MMQFEDWVNRRNISMERFWLWYNTKVIPKKVGPAGGWLMYHLITVLDCEWEIQEYGAA